MHLAWGVPIYFLYYILYINLNQQDDTLFKLRKTQAQFTKALLSIFLVI